MNVIQTSQVLSRIQAYHGGFEVTKEKVAAWFELLEPYEFRDCIEAVKSYFKSPGDWIMPSDIIERVKEYQQDRIGRFGLLRLSDADERTMIERGTTWRDETRKLWNMAANGHITPDEHAAYLEGNMTLGSIVRQEITR